MRKKSKKTNKTFFDYFVLVIIILFVFFSFDLILYIKQNYFSSQLRLKEIARVDYISVIKDIGEIKKSKISSTDIKSNNSESAKVENKIIDSDETKIQSEVKSESKVELKKELDKELEKEENETSLVKSINPEQIFVANNQINIIFNNNLIAYNDVGKSMWIRNVLSTNPYILQAKNNILIVNKDTGSIIKIDKKNKEVAHNNNLGIIDEIKTVDEICVVKIKGMNRLIVLDKLLEVKSEINIDYGDIVDFELSDDEKSVLISVLNINQYKLESFVLQYPVNSRGEASGTSDLKDELVYSMVSPKNIIIASDNKIRAYDVNSNLINELSNRDMLFEIKYNSDKIYTVNLIHPEISSDEIANEFVDSPKLSTDEARIEKSIELKTYSHYLEELKSTKFTNIDFIIVSDKYVVINDSEIIKLYDTRMNLIDKKQISSNIHSLKWIDDHKFLIIGQDMVYIYSIS